MFRIANCDHGMHFFNQFLFLVIVEIHVPFGETRFASTILYQYKANLKIYIEMKLNGMELQTIQGKLYNGFYHFFSFISLSISLTLPLCVSRLELPTAALR